MLFKFVSVLLSASVERVGVSSMLDLFFYFKFVLNIFTLIRLLLKVSKGTIQQKI